MRKVWLIFSQTATVAMAVLFVVATFKPQWLQSATWRPALPGPTVATAPAVTASSGRSVSGVIPQTGFADAAKRAAPTVVSVVTNASPVRNQRGDQWFR